MRAGSRRFTALGIVALTLLARPSLAQKHKKQQSEADRLFDEGAALMKQNKYSEACAKFAASNRLDPEIGGLLWLADCYERNGQTASAYKTYKDAQKMAIERHDKKQRDKVAQRHIDDLETRLTKLTVLAPVDGRPDGLEVTRDGDTLGSSDFGLAVPVDPGMHTIKASAPHYEKWEKRIEASGDGETVKVTVGPMQKIYVAPPKPPVEEGTENDPAFAYHVGGIVTGSVGLIALGVGSAFGLIASGKLDESNSNGHCDAADTCDLVGLQLRSDAKDAALASTILFVAGGVALAAGITIFFLAPHKKHVAATFGNIAPVVGPGLYGAALSGSF
jgi:tetratricopeptide (TPR) repeat protein